VKGGMCLGQKVHLLNGYRCLLSFSDPREFKTAIFLKSLSKQDNCFLSVAELFQVNRLFFLINEGC